MKISFESKSTKKVDTLVVFAEEGGKLTDPAKDLDKKTKGLLKKAIKADDFKGKIGDSVIITAPAGVSADRIVVAGVGKLSDVKARDFEKVGSSLVDALGKKSASLHILLGFEAKKIKEAVLAGELSLGLTLNSYRFNKHFNKERKGKELKLKSASVQVKSVASAKKEYARQCKLADGVFLARDLVSEVPNVLYPESYAKIIKKELEPLGVKVTVLGRAQLKKLGAGAMMSVGRGSVREEKLVIMEYKGAKNKSTKNVALIGKGITFDTGGISLKPPQGMWDMKWDMGGSAAVVGAMKALAGRKAKANIVAAVALAENMPDGDATRPGDVVKSMSGQTVEILNTDAEGRLVLCDAMWYVQEKYKPTHMIDLATLTGAVLMALGNEFAAVFSNDDTMPKQIVDAGSAVGDDTWQMPLCDNWHKEMESKIADVKNISNSRLAGSATAAHFLKRFVQKGVKWSHIDIAGVAWRDKASASNPSGATGFGVRLLDRYIETHFEK